MRMSGRSLVASSPSCSPPRPELFPGPCLGRETENTKRSQCWLENVYRYGDVLVVFIDGLAFQGLEERVFILVEHGLGQIGPDE